MHASIRTPTMCGMGSNLWSTYVLDVAPRGGHKQSEIADRAGVSQGAISKWMAGKAVPDKAVHVAGFARACGRNVLEAFVAAGLLSEADAGRGLPPASREYLAELREVHARLPQGVDPAAYRAVRKTLAERIPATGETESVEKVKRPGRRA